MIAKKPPIYVAATSQHVGKTTSTLGLIHAIQARGIEVGYCKPVGQQFVDLGNLQVDKDAILFANVMRFELEGNLHSPVILGPGATAGYLDAPHRYDYPSKIRQAADVLHARHELVVYEGTGHPGVGSVVGLSNADVAKMLGARVIMVVEGGIGSTIDRLNMSLALFREREVPILGVIANKVLPDKLDKIQHYLHKYLADQRIPLLGVVPFEKTLANPLMATIAHSVQGYTIANEHNLDNPVEDIVAGSLIDIQELKKFKNLLLLVSFARLDDAIRKLKSIAATLGTDQCPLAGIIVTMQGEISESSMAYIMQHEIPLVSTPLDTYGSVVKISRIEVKINTRTPWKVRKAVNLFKENVNLNLIFDSHNQFLQP